MNILLNEKTIKKLTLLINEEIDYKSGPELVSFFNKFGYDDIYGKGFPSRFYYTEEKLRELNGTSFMALVIQEVFSPINFIERENKLEKIIENFNKYLYYDEYQVINMEMNVVVDKINPNDKNKKELKKNDYEVFNRLNIENDLKKILENRLKESEIAFYNELYLTTIILSGTILEGVLFFLANENKRDFNTASSSPKNEDNKPKKFKLWTLSDLIDVSYELGYLNKIMNDISATLREYRNYIHPREQLHQEFEPDRTTAKMCLNLVKEIIEHIEDISKEKK